MGFECPVCEAPQRDGEHLADHLAFTAMLHGETHETWLDEHIPQWSQLGTQKLAERVEPLADSAEYHEVFEDTVRRGHHQSDESVFPDNETHRGRDDMTRTTAIRTEQAQDVDSVLQEARKLTREMMSDEETE
ncbi:MAG: hypothetical protein J07HQX50_02594 [Haloquadratum sp. J07HQX50]|jgi:hypothetical protein|nr:MAG: hypothetical protein J07HQX50_02594 [Haloquadratum sp. J07HQX50]